MKMSATKTYEPAEAFPAGEVLRDEIESRGWRLTDFADLVGRSQQEISKIIHGHKEITQRIVSEIAVATCINAEAWLQLQDASGLPRRG